jgi:tRNA(fMet)-specific endonuclease VapC
MAMILDTNALSAFAEGDDSLGAQLETSAQLYLPVVVLGEYRYGVRQSRHQKAYEGWLDEVLSELVVVHVLESTTVYYAALWHELKRSGHAHPHQ